MLSGQLVYTSNLLLDCCQCRGNEKLTNIDGEVFKLWLDEDFNFRWDYECVEDFENF